jgi:ClpP class serine protease
MPTKSGLLARIFGRAGKNPVVSQLYTHALGQPLMVHPAIGERLIGAYLSGAVDAPSGEMAATSGSIAVLNICGPLVNRPMPGLCDAGPVSYTAIRSAFDEALADDNVKAIVFRMDSPGGMCAGCFDLTDYVFASRGKKPIVAQIDDMAFSAAYALASACDSIQTTRTGGGANVGVYTYHVDYSGANSKAGVVVTYIYAGEKKVDGNPDEPLSDSAKADAQARVDKLYDLFATSVAKYRGMDVQTVIDSQAADYTGGDLVLAGFADSVGTFEDLLTKLSAPESPKEPEMADENTQVPPTAPAPAAPVATLTEQQTASIALAAITSAVMAAAPALRSDIAMTLLDPNSGVTAETVDARIAHARQVADLCVAGKLKGCEAGYIQRNTPIEAVRAELQAAQVDTGPELVTAQPESKGKGKSTVQGIYESRRAAAAGHGKNRGNR